MLTLQEQERFWSKVEITDGCWLWLAGRNSNGYGSFGFQGKCYGAHVIAFADEYGCLPSPLSVCHFCDNRICVRPDHMWIGTNLDNWDDMRTKMRHTHGEAHAAAKFSDEDIANIRLLRSQGVSGAELARRYGVHKVTAEVIIRGKAWKHVAAEADRTIKTNVRGSQHPKAKLTEGDIPIIRNLIASGRSRISVADEFGISQWNIGFIVRRVTWKHVS